LAITELLLDAKAVIEAATLQFQGRGKSQGKKGSGCAVTSAVFNKKILTKKIPFYKNKIII
jgi:hypothetical protein